MKDVLCSCCDKHLIQVPDSDTEGTIAAKVLHAGYQAKNPVLLIGKSMWLSFCSTNCKEIFYGYLKIDPVRQEEVKEWAERCKAEAPAFAKKLSENIEKVKQALLPYVKSST